MFWNPRYELSQTTLIASDQPPEGGNAISPSFALAKDWKKT